MPSPLRGSLGFYYCQTDYSSKYKLRKVVFMLGKHYAFSSARPLVFVCAFACFVNSWSKISQGKVCYCYGYPRHTKSFKTCRDVLCLG